MPDVLKVVSNVLKVVPDVLKVVLDVLMGEGFILLTRGYGFMEGVYHPPFDTLKIGGRVRQIVVIF